MKNFVDFRNEIRDVKRMVQDLLIEVQPKFYSPYEYIKVKDNFELLLCHRGVYYKSSNLAALCRTLARHHIDIDSRTLRRLMDNPDRWNEIWGLGVETVVGKRTESGRWICSDGNFLKSNLSRYITSPKHSTIYLTDAFTGEEESFNRAEWVYWTFINPDYEGTIYFTDGNYTNCAVYNLRELDSTKRR